MVTVNGTDFRISEPSLFSLAWYSHKFKSAAVRYEVAVSINGGNIVHINRLFCTGSWPEIFSSHLIHWLSHGKMVEAYRRYQGRTNAVRLPVGRLSNSTQKKQKGKARAQHKTVNRHFKHFGILWQFFVTMHPGMTWAYTKLPLKHSLWSPSLTSILAFLSSLSTYIRRPPLLLWVELKIECSTIINIKRDR